jgi:hypothetical protein
MSAPGARIPPYVVGCLATLAVPLLYSPWISAPHIRYDDFAFLTKSRTYTDTLAHLWEPMNEHLMPLARLDAGALMWLVTPQSLLPLAAQLHGVLAVIIGMWLLYRFVHLEFGHPFYGVLAMIAWGVTTTYYENVTWYSASFFTLGLDVTLVAFLAAQRFERSGGRSALALCVVCCALAPAFHSTAGLAGAWCTLYLALSPGARGTTASAWRRLTAAAPLAGTVLFVVVAALTASDEIVSAAHYRGKTFVGAFDPVEGVKNTLRTLADNQVPGLIGVWDRHSTFSWPVVWTVVGSAGVLAFVWWRGAPRRRLLVLGLAIIVTSNLIVYGARADWNYDRSVHNWTRYHLFPHLGIVLFVIGGLVRFEGTWFQLASNGRLTARQSAALVLLIVGLFACHWPRSRGSTRPASPPGSMRILRVRRSDSSSFRSGSKVRMRGSSCAGARRLCRRGWMTPLGCCAPWTGRRKDRATATRALPQGRREDARPSGRAPDRIEGLTAGRGATHGIRGSSRGRRIRT